MTSSTLATVQGLRVCAESLGGESDGALHTLLCNPPLTRSRRYACDDKRMGLIDSHVLSSTSGLPAGKRTHGNLSCCYK